MLIKFNALAALAAEKQSMAQQADDYFRSALMLASQGRFVGMIRNIGGQIKGLIERISDSDIHPEYIRQLRQVFGLENTGDALTSSSVEPVSEGNENSVQQTTWQPLSNRELDILNLFGKRLSNQEIADELTISVNTVKRHAINIYNKLEVHNRREAVEKAAEMQLNL